MEDKENVKPLDEKEAQQFRKELDGLLVEFKELIDIAKRVEKEEEEAKMDFDSMELNSEDKDKFFAWNKKFEELLDKAVASNLIEQEFIDKHKDIDYDWENDPFWSEVKNHFQERDKYSEEVEFLRTQRIGLESSHNERVDDYKLAALITSWTIAIPIIIAAIYLIDRFLITLPTIKDKQEAASPLTKDKTVAESELKKHGTDIQRDLYYQAAKAGTTHTFFRSLKEEVKETEEAKKPSSSITPKPSSE